MSQFVKRDTPARIPAGVLSQLDCELTERCNNRCLHCCINRPEDDMDARGRELSYDQWASVLREAAALGCMRVRFTGGEPLLRDDFQDLYRLARGLGMKVLLFTNARLITPGLADLFARVPPLVYIEVTVYGMNSSTYDTVAGVRGAYEQFKAGVDLLLDRKVPFVVKSAWMPQNAQDVQAFETWAATIPWMDKPPSYSLFFDLRNRRGPGEDAANRRIRRVRADPEAGVAFLTRNAERYRRTTVEFGAKFMGPNGSKLFRCGAGRRSGCIDAYGMLQPCMGVRAPELCVPLFAGEKTTPLAEALTRFEQLAQLEASHPEYLARCAQCFIGGLCEMCPGKSWTEHGVLDRPVEYLCDVAHAQARWMGWLQPGERSWEVPDAADRLACIRAEYAERLAASSGASEGNDEHRDA